MSSYVGQIAFYLISLSKIFSPPPQAFSFLILDVIPRIVNGKEVKEVE